MEWCFPSLLYQNCRGADWLSRNDVSYRRSLEISIIIITPFLLSKNSTIFGFILEIWFNRSLFFVDLKLILLTNLHVEFYKFRRSYHHFPSLVFIFFVYFFYGSLQANASPLLISFEAISGDAQIGELSEYLKSNSCPFLQ